MHGKIQIITKSTEFGHGIHFNEEPWSFWFRNILKNVEKRLYSGYHGKWMHHSSFK